MNLAIVGEPGHGKTLGLLKSFPDIIFVGPQDSHIPLETVFGIKRTSNIFAVKYIADLIANLEALNRSVAAGKEIFGVIHDDFSILSANTLARSRANGAIIWDALAAYNTEVTTYLQMLEEVKYHVFITGHYQGARAFRTPEGKEISLPGSIMCPGWVIPTAFPSRIGTFLRTDTLDNPIGFKYGITQDTPVSVTKDRNNIIPPVGVIPNNIRELFLQNGIPVPPWSAKLELQWIQDFIDTGAEQLKTKPAQTVLSELRAKYKDKSEQRLQLAESHLVDRVLIANHMKLVHKTRQTELSRLSFT